MVSPISSANGSQAIEAAKSSASKPQPQQQHQTAQLPPDTVTLKSSGDVDHDGDRK
jgi:hypothetical protein